MENTTNNVEIGEGDAEFKKFAWLRIIGAIILVLALLWAITWLIDVLDLSRTGGSQTAETKAQPSKAAQHTQMPESHRMNVKAEPKPGSHEMADSAKEAAGNSHAKGPTGTLFVDSLIEPINHELNERFWGWRPNDILNVTDNVNEIQLGILEVTRRTTVALTEKISRTGSASALNEHLENAMNAFMIGADSYWMPSAESAYNGALDDLKRYKKQLIRGEASFYTRSDSLIPLLQALEELLGSCDENLVKQKEDDGEPVSTFKADNYFYYAKGVAMAMTTILHAVDEEFSRLLETRDAKDIMHHAIESAHHASRIDPWIMVTEGSLNGILANHRANMAAHISHARYYLGLLTKTLST